MQQQSGEGAYRRKSDLLLARMSHDIRTPMNSIVGLSHLCLQTELNSRQREYLENIQDAAVSLVGILNDIFDFSRVESGKADLRSEAFQMTELLQKISDTVRLRAEKKGLEVLFRVAPDMPEYLEGDSYRLYQVLVNLVSNAVRFTKQGEVIVSVELLERDGDKLQAHFSIRDTGIGMSKAQVEHIGHFFSLPLEQQLFPETHPDAGLGLVLALMLVRLMGGKIWAESEIERGSVFHISLELKAGAAPAPRTIPAGLLRNLHVLVVDDNLSARIILVEALTSFGFRVESAESGLEALDMLQRACERDDPFALVLLDWKMPGLDGVETALCIRDNAAINSPPQLLMVSASALDNFQRQGMDAGIQGFLLKPVNRSHLFDSIVRVFAKEQSCPEAQLSTGPEESAGGRDDGLDPLRGARILLVEDNEINQQIAMELLQHVGAVAISASNGLEALNILREQQFDAVLMDIQMPVMDGLEAARRARELPVPGMRSLPILAMTAHALESDKKKSLQAGMQEHLTKPIEPARMYETLAKWIRAGREEAALNAQPGAAPTGGITDMPGLSVQNALKNLAGNVTLYIKLLKRFVESYEHAAGQVSNALAAGDQELALRLAHTVKGVAANLGATSLAQIAGDVETALAANKGHDVLLAQMRDVLRQTIESIRCLIAATTKQAATVAQEKMSAERQVEVVALLRATPELMSSDWISTQRQLQSLKSLLGHSATASAYAALMQAVDDFDADALREQTEKIIAHIQSG